MNGTLKISMDLARQVLPCLQAQLESWERRQLEADGEVGRLKGAIAELQAKLDETVMVKPSGEKRERLPKGYGDKLILDLLSKLEDGQGLSMTEIEHRTGINHATVYKTLNNPKRNKGRFEREGKLWSWTGK